MGKTIKKIGKGLLWGLGSLFSASVAAITGWIIYSRKFINHKIQLGKAIETEQKEFQSVKAGRVSYYVDEKGSGKPLVLLHSINAAPSAFEIKPIFEYFRGKRPVFALDLPGFGFSERSNRIYNPQLYQNAITDFLSEVVADPADIVALSLSSEFAALSAAHDPKYFRSLVMISPTGFNLPKINKNAAEVGGGMRELAYNGLAFSLWNRPFFDLVSSRPSIRYFLNQSFEGLVPDQFVDYAYQTAHQPGAQYAPTFFLSGKLFTPAVRETVYKALEIPVLVLYDRDPFTNFEMLPPLIHEKDNWRAERISPTKGLPHWEKPDKVFAAMQAFWDAL